MRILSKIALVLILVGAVNWGMIGLFRLDLVALLFGANSMLSRLVYSLVGLSAILYIVLPRVDTVVNV